MAGIPTCTCAMCSNALLNTRSIASKSCSLGMLRWRGRLSTCVPDRGCRPQGAVARRESRRADLPAAHRTALSQAGDLATNPGAGLDQAVQTPRGAAVDDGLGRWSLARVR